MWLLACHFSHVAPVEGCGDSLWSRYMVIFLSPFSQCGAENGRKRKKDRDLDELKKEVALVRKTSCRCSNTHLLCVVIDSNMAAHKTLSQIMSRQIHWVI